jgi:ethanolamine kinase
MKSLQFIAFLCAFWRSSSANLEIRLPEALQEAEQQGGHNLCIIKMTMSANGQFWREQCLSLLSFVFPDLDLGDTCVEPCVGGLTNRLFKAHVKAKDLGLDLQLLIRVFGAKTEYIIDRQAELHNMLMLGERGLAGKIHGIFENGYVYEYIVGTPLSPVEMPEHYQLIAREMATCHSIKPNDSSVGPSLFTTLRNYLNMVDEADIDRSERHAYTEIINRLESAFKDEPVVFCHNDLGSVNIILSEDSTAVKFIDYEYGSFNIAVFDLANHFCEYAGNECDWTRLPDDDQMARFIAAYNPQIESKEMINKIHKCMSASHLLLGLLGLIYSRHSDIEYDYAGYGRRRLAMLKSDI